MSELVPILPLIFTICLCVSALILILYYAIIFSRFAFSKAKKIRDYHQDPVSVIITASDQAHHLIHTLPVLLEQQYNNFEVIVVSDNSHDETAQVIEDFQKKYSNLVFVNLDSSVSTIKGKKFPLSVGIKEAKNDIIVLTDAHCMPVSPYWLQNIAKHFGKGKEIVLGYCTLEKQPGLFNRLLRFDALQTAIQYFSYSICKMTYRGNGRNLAFKKSLFFQQRGFASHNHLEYGDDDIFIGKAATAQNCEIEYFGESFTMARPKATFRRWFREKKGYLYTRPFYKSGIRFLLGLYSLTNVLFYIFFALSLAYSIPLLTMLIVVLSVFAFKTICQHLVFGFSAGKLKEKDIIPHLFPIDLIYSFLSIFIFLGSKFNK